MDYSSPSGISDDFLRAPFGSVSTGRIWLWTTVAAEATVGEVLASDAGRLPGHRRYGKATTAKTGDEA